MRKPIRGAALLLLVVPGMVWGLGLGNIEVDTALNQPLSAEIRVLSIDPAQVPDVRVSLASQEAFDRIGLVRPFVLSQLEFKPTVKPNGEVVIEVTSKAPIREPFLNFIIDVQWPAGHMLREYTILLDPPTLMEERRVIAAQPPATAPAVPERTVPDTSTVAERPAPAPVRETVTAAMDRNYTVESGDTLSEIASNTFGADSEDLPQVMLALLRANPDAFFEDNINNLKAGVILRMPSPGEINALTRDEAIAEVSRQNALWREYRTQLAENASPQPLPRNSTTAAAAAADAEVPTGESAPAEAGTVDKADATESAGEQLQILASNAADPSSDIMLVAGGDSVAALREQTALARELAESRGQELDELSARVRELESMLSKQQRIINLQSDQLSDLQQRYGTEPLAHDGQITVPAATREPVSGTAPEQTAEPAAPRAEQASVPVAGDGVITVPAADRPAQPAQRPVKMAQTITPVAGDGVIVVPAAVRARNEQGGGEAAPGMGVEAVETAAQTQAEAMAADESPATVAAVAGEESTGAVAVAGAPSELQTAAQTDAEPALPDFLTGLLGNPRLLLGLAGGVLLLIALGAYWKQRRAAARTDAEEIYAAEEDIPAATVSTAGAVGQTRFTEPEEFAAADMAATAQDNQDDVMGEADVYLAYGLHPQAIDLLKEVLEQDAGRNDYRLKLLEAYRGAGDRRGFDAELQALRTSVGDESSPYWQQAVELGRGFSSDHASPGGDSASGSDWSGEFPTSAETGPVDSDEETLIPASHESEPGSDDDFDAALSRLDLEATAIDETDKTLELSREEMEFIDEQAKEQRTATGAEPAAEDSHSALEFNLSGVDLPEPHALEETADDEDQEPASEARDDVLEVDFGPGDTGIRVARDPFTAAPEDDTAEPSSEEEEAFAVELDDPTLLLRDGERAETDDGRKEADQTLLQNGADFTDTALMSTDVTDDDTLVLDEDLSSEQDLDGTLLDGVDEVGTKLDLAKAFIDMGDADGARSALEEVLQEGNSDQRQEAEGLMAQIA